jgi:predicted nucleic acid-binding protein
MGLYFDANALVKLYKSESGSATMRDIFGRPEFAGGLFVSEFVALEVVAALAKARRSGVLSRKAHRRAVREFWTDYPAVFNVLTVDSFLVDQALRLGQEHWRSAAGAGDLLHLASVLHLSAFVPNDRFFLVTSDGALKALSARAGVLVFDPETASVRDLDPPLFG